MTPSEDRASRATGALSLALLALACVQVQDPATQEEAALMIVPNAGGGPLRVELGERLALRLEVPPASGQTVEWTLDPPQAGTLSFEAPGAEACFTAGAWSGDALITASVRSGAALVDEAQVVLGIAPPEIEAALLYSFAGDADYELTGSSLDLAGGVLAVGHSAEREVDGESFGKFATLARYTASGAAAFLDVEPRSQVLAVAVDRSAAPADAHTFALVAEHDPASGQTSAPLLRRFDADWVDVAAWSAPELEYAPILATDAGELLAVARPAGAAELVLLRLDGSGGELGRTTLSGVSQLQHVRGVTAREGAVHVLTDVDLLAFDRDLQPLDGFDADGTLPYATLRALAGPDGKGRLLVCGGDTLHFVNAEGREVHTLTGLDYAVGGEPLFEDLLGVAVDGASIRLYDRPQLAPGETGVTFTRLVELEAQVFPPVVTIDPPGAILNLGWTRTFTVRENGFRRAGLSLDPSVAAGGTVVDVGNGDYRYTGGGAIGTWQLALVDSSDPQVRATSYVTLTAFNFGFDAPTTGPGQFVHDLRVAMAGTDTGFFVSYYNEDRESDGIDHYLRYFSYDEEFELSSGDSIQPYTAESPVVNVAASADGTAYWLDESGGGHLRLRSWRPGELARSFPMVGLDGLRYDGDEATSAIAAAPAFPGSGAATSLYWVHDDGGVFFMYRYDVPVNLVDGDAITPVTEVVLDPAAPDEVPMDLAVAADGTVYTRTSQSTFVGRLSPGGGVPGYGYEPFWLDAGQAVVSVEVGAGDLLLVNVGDRVRVHNRDGLLLEELSGYQPDLEDDHGQVGFEDVRDLVADRERGRLRLLDRIYTDANSPQGSIAILGLEVDPR